MINRVHHGYAESILPMIEAESVALSFWSPPYFVGKEYERDTTFESWQEMLRVVIAEHSRILRPGGFLVVNIADIRCYRDPSLPRFQASNPAMRKSAVTREMVVEAKAAHPDWNRYQLAAYLGCSEQTIDRRLNGNNIRGGKHADQTRVHVVGGHLQEYALAAGLPVYDHRIWVKDPAWANSKWTINSLKSVDEYEDLYVFWKPGPQVIDRSRLTPDEWREWGSRAIWSVRSVRANDDHEAKFPFTLAERVVRLYSGTGDTVLDPFLGSGTTAIAALKHGRHYIGVEKEQKYVALSERNIESFQYGATK